GISVAASAAWAAATVLARKIRGVKPQKMQGLLALVAGPMLMLGSILFEPPMGPALAKATPLVWASIVWAGLVSTVLATGLLFWLVQRREAGRVTPYLLTTPVVSVLIGILFMGDVLTLQIVLGGSAVIGGVALVALAERRIKAAQARQTAQIMAEGAPATEKDAA
ncbi:MAG: DMT family transporter, partial [Asticcacaulis sp.]